MTTFISSAYAQDLPPAPAELLPPEGTETAPVAAPGEPVVVQTEVGHAADDAHGGAFPPFDPATFPSQLLWLTITFGLLYWIISKVAAPRIASILEVRRDRIAADLGEAERLRGETDAAIAAYEQSLAEARQRAGAIAAETREQVNRDLEARRQAIEADLSAKVGEAEARIAAIKNQALADVDGIATETTEAIVAALIGKSTRKEAAAAVTAVRRG
jgi:F-type H+-transporting ATPase subunit b